MAPTGWVFRKRYGTPSIGFVSRVRKGKRTSSMGFVRKVKRVIGGAALHSQKQPRGSCDE